MRDLTFEEISTGRYRGFTNKETWSFCIALLNRDGLYYQMREELGTEVIEALKKYNETGSAHTYAFLNEKVEDCLLNIYRNEMKKINSGYFLNVCDMVYDLIDFTQIADDIIDFKGDFLGVFTEEDDDGVY